MNDNVDVFTYVDEWYQFHPEPYYQSWWMRPVFLSPPCPYCDGTYARMGPSWWDAGAYPLLLPYYPLANAQVDGMDPWVLQDYHGVWW